jgi:transposase-like protein
MSRTGRPTKLTPELQEEILRGIRAGAYPEVAAQRVGIGSSTFYQWMQRGRQAREAGHPDQFTEFAEAVEEAKGHAETRAVAVVLKAAEKSWRAAAWWLERTRPQRYGHKHTLEHGGDPENPLTMILRWADDNNAHLHNGAPPGAQSRFP